MSKEHVNDIVAIKRSWQLVPGDEGYQDYLRERIYGSITLLTVNVGLLLHDSLTVRGAYVAIISTALGLWMAGLLASFLSYRVVHGRSMPMRALRHEVAVHRGLILAAVPSLIMISLAAFSLISLRTAIITDISLAFVSMAIIVFRSTRSSAGIWIAATSVLAQAVIAGIIIMLKLGH